MATTLKTAKEELDELLTNLDNAGHAALDELISVMPCSVKAFNKIAANLPQKTRETYAAQIEALTKLNALLDLDSGNGKSAISVSQQEIQKQKPMGFGPDDEIELDILQLLQSDKPESEKKGALVEELLRRYDIKTLDDTEEMLYYQGGIYKTGAETKLKAELENIGQHLINNHMRNEVLASIRARTYVSRADFDQDPDIINLRNGLFNLATGEYTEHSADYLSVIQLPVDYNPKATCKPIIEALYNTFEEPTDVPLFLEWLAYTIFWRNKDLQKEMLLVGPPECGKSVILNILIALLGSQNVSAVTFQQLTTNRFALAQLYGKLANIYADITHTRVEDIERFKAIATADEVEAEKKGLQLFKFRPNAKQTYSCNIPPRPPISVDDSFYRRWIIINCAWRDNDYFTGKQRVKDRDVLTKLATEENLSGLLNLVIISAKRLMKRKRFCKELPTDTVREEYDRLSSPVQLWIENCCEEDGEGYIEKKQAFASYVKFCKSRKIGAGIEVWFGRELSQLGFIDGRKGTSKKDEKRVWLGLKLKELETGKGSFSATIGENNPVLVQGEGALLDFKEGSQ